MIEWRGYLYDGVTADRQPVTLVLESLGVRVVKPDGTSTVWPVDQLRQTQGSFSSEQLRLEFGTDPVQAVIVESPGFIEAMRNAYPSARKNIRGYSDVKRFALFSIVALAAAATLYVFGAPVATAWAAERVPVSWEEKLGQSVVDDMVPEAMRCGNPSVVAAAQAVLDRLVQADSSSPYTFRLFVSRDTVVNAFAAPGGYVVVNAGLMHAAETPEQLAGVLAHEVQHVKLRHTTKGILRDAPLRIGIAAIFGGTGAEQLAGAVGALNALSYRRSDEAQADREGMLLMSAAKVDPEGMVQFMSILEKRGNDLPGFATWMSSHPNTADRVEDLARQAKTLHVASTAIMPAAEWKAARAASCGAMPDNILRHLP